MLQGVTWISARVSQISIPVDRASEQEFHTMENSSQDYRGAYTTSICDWKQSDAVFESHTSRLVAFRGFLRPEINLERVVMPDGAAQYFDRLIAGYLDTARGGEGNNFACCNGICKSHCCRDISLHADPMLCDSSCPETASESNSVLDYQKKLSLRLLDITPYSRWWMFYKTGKIVGNAYLWQAIQGDAKRLPAVLCNVTFHK